MMVKNKLKAKLHKWKEKIGNKLFAGKRRKKLNNTDFSIICNNCWGGFVYRYFGLPYLSPTVGLYFYSEDFIKFAKDIHKYITMPITIISAKNSRHYEDLKRKGQETKYQCARYYPGYENCKDIRNDTDQFAKYVNLVDLIND